MTSIKVGEICLGDLLKNNECKHWVTITRDHLPYTTSNDNQTDVSHIMMHRKEIIELLLKNNHELTDHFVDKQEVDKKEGYMKCIIC